MDRGFEEGGMRERDDALDELLLAPAAILAGLPDAVVASAADGRIVYVNALAEELFGYSRAELVGKPVQTLWPERIRARYTRNMELYFATEHPLRFSSEAWGIRRDGSEFVGEMSWGIVETEAGKLLLAIGRDVSERRAADRRLRAVAAMGERALAGADPADVAGEAVELMRATLPVTGAQVALADGSILAGDSTLERSDVRLGIGEGSALTAALERELADEELVFLRTIANTLATALARLAGEERMRHEAVHDPLTGLANRTLLRDRLEHALARSERDEEMATGVLFVDLDNFKQVNDEYGHQQGDEVLVLVADVLRDFSRDIDAPARYGGEELAVVLPQTDAEGAAQLAERIREAVERLEVPRVDGEGSLRLQASFGVAALPESAVDREGLIAAADAALYRAKRAGRNRVERAEPVRAAG
jgi:diguanylate cyclase (GGDEF)-like protein/PAS domain S-box-containing protein